MKKLLIAVSALVCLAIGAQAQYTTITAASIKVGGAPVQYGTVTFTPVNMFGTAIPFSTGGGGLNSPQAFSCTISSGAISGTCQVPDSSLTAPANILYSIQVTDSTSGKTFTLQAVPNVSGTTWALDTYGPSAQTTNSQNLTVSYGTAVPTACATPSMYIRNYNGGQLYMCVNGQSVQVTGSSGTGSTVTTATIAGLGALTNNITGNAATATHASTSDSATTAATSTTAAHATLADTAMALAAAPTTCPAGQAPKGVDASGNALGCTAASVTAATIGAVGTLTNSTSGTAANANHASTADTATTATSATTATNATHATAADTATALAATPTSCASGQFPTGFDTHGNATGCFTPSAGSVTSSSIAAAGQLSNNTTGQAATAVALAATPTKCPAGQLAQGVDASGNSLGCAAAASPTASSIASVGTLANSTTGNASTATALAALPTKCAAGQLAQGVDASGNALGCAAAASPTASSIASVGTLANSTTGNASTATALAATPTKCATGQLAQGVDASGNALGCAAAAAPTASSIASVGTLSNDTSGKAAKATALAATPTACAAGLVAQGVDASGNALGCVAPTGSGASAPASTALYKGTGTANQITTATPGVDYARPATTDHSIGAMGFTNSEDTNTSNNGVAGAVAAGAKAIVVPATSTSTEQVSYNAASTSVAQHVIDERTGEMHYFHNLGASTAGGFSGALMSTQGWDLATGTGPGFITNTQINSILAGPGVDFVGNYRIAFGLQTQHTNYAAGTSQAVTVNDNGNKEGDDSVLRIFQEAFGGMRASTNEGIKGLYMLAGMNRDVYQATIASTTAGALTLTCTQNCGVTKGPSGGGKLINYSHPVATGYITAVTPTTGSYPEIITVSNTLTAPTWVGRLNSAITVPVNVTTGTSQTFSVTTVSGTPATGVSTRMMCANYPESIMPTAASATSITALLQYPHPNDGCLMTQGGTGGSGGPDVEQFLTASPSTGQTAIGATHTIRPNYTMQAISTTQMAVPVWIDGGLVNMHAGGHLDGALSISVVNLSRTSNVVTACPQGSPSIPTNRLFVGQSLVVSGASDVTLNGTVTGVATTPAPLVSGAVMSQNNACFSWNQTGANTTAATATITIGGTGSLLSAYTVYPSVKIKEVIVPHDAAGGVTQQTPSQVKTESAAVYGTAGDVVEEQHPDSNVVHGISATYNYATPSTKSNNYGMFLTFMGPGAAGNFSGVTLDNNNPYYMYQGYTNPSTGAGGELSPTPAINLNSAVPNGGLWSNWISGASPSQGGTMFDIRTPVDGFNASTSNFCFYNFGTYGGSAYRDCVDTYRSFRSVGFNSSNLVMNASQFQFQTPTVQFGDPSSLPEVSLLSTGHLLQFTGSGAPVVVGAQTAYTGANPNITFNLQGNSTGGSSDPAIYGAVVVNAHQYVAPGANQSLLPHFTVNQISDYPGLSSKSLDIDGLGVTNVLGLTSTGNLSAPALVLGGAMVAYSSTSPTVGATCTGTAITLAGDGGYSACQGGVVVAKSGGTSSGPASAPLLKTNSAGTLIAAVPCTDFLPNSPCDPAHNGNFGVNQSNTGSDSYTSAQHDPGTTTLIYDAKMISGVLVPCYFTGTGNATGAAGCQTIGASAVSSVFGRTGAVVAAANDYSFAQLSGTVALGQLPTIPISQVSYSAATGCTTAGYVYVPASNSCVAQSSGGGGAVTTADNNFSASQTVSTASGNAYFNVNRAALAGDVVGLNITTAGVSGSGWIVGMTAGSTAIKLHDNSANRDALQCAITSDTCTFLNTVAATYVSTPVTITASATPAIVTTGSELQTITLTANATPTVSGIAAGQKITLQICQDSTGGRTWAWPTAFHGGITIGSTASTCTQQSFASFNGTTMVATTAGVTGVAP